MLRLPTILFHSGFQLRFSISELHVPPNPSSLFHHPIDIWWPRWRNRLRFQDNIGIDLREVGLWVWTEFICLRIGSHGRLLWIW
jgi:hypothetical protein